MRIQNSAILITFLLVICVAANAQHFIDSNEARLIFNQSRGTYSIIDRDTRDTLVSQAFFRVAEWKSTHPGNKFSIRQFPIEERGLKGRAIEVIALSNDSLLTVRWTTKSFLKRSFFIQEMAIRNNSNTALQLKDWSPFSDGVLHPGKRKVNARMLDGNGGGESTMVHDAGYMRCRNNVLLTFDDESKRRYSFVAGGIRYRDFEKHSALYTDQIRRSSIANANASQGLTLISYLDLGEDPYDLDKTGRGLMVERAWPYNFHNAQIRELGSTVYADEKIIISAKNLDANTQYSFGFSWMDEGGGRVQSVFVDNGEGTARFPMLSRRHLPSISQGKSPEELVIAIPAAALKKGSCRIIIQADKGPNAVLSEAWLNEGWPKEHPLRQEISYSPPTYFLASAYAQDPVGKRIDANTWYAPKDDLFYIDAESSDPFQAVETYGMALRLFQEVKNLAYYTFPTVCLWYASHQNYGGGPSVNDSPGAVAEMDRAIESGFTRFSTVAIRLVPDNYSVNNEQGWWDDAHWQRYGSGDDNPNSVIVKGAHYKTPFETTKKWASAIRERGGLPFTYFQTARRSQDFCDSFPQYMLFNESNHIIPDSNWLTLGKSSYDFTDAGFQFHMRKVYKNLRDGGVRGMMFDYTSTAWADFGGMEDKYSTAAAMYRKVFELAYTGLGGTNWIHERNLERGTDLTLGLVASQRVWGDTDGITPEMVSRTGLRWYKNRVVTSYDMDSKNTEKLRLESRDLLRQMLTMAYVASGRLLLGNSFEKMTSTDVHDLSRIFPFHSTTQSARPIDAFISKWPTVYDFKISDAWHVLTLYNVSDANETDFAISMKAPNYQGGLELEKNQKYHLYDFWNDRYIGLFNGDAVLNQTLRKSEARVISFHQVTKHPQFISTNRHIFQGFLDLKDLKWDAGSKKYSGIASVVAKDPFQVVIATNGYNVKTCAVDVGNCSLVKGDSPGIVTLEINSESSGEIKWTLTAD